MCLVQLLVAACEQLLTVSNGVPRRPAVWLLGADSDLVVGCGVGDAAVGVITKTGVVAQILEARVSQVLAVKVRVCDSLRNGSPATVPGGCQ